MTRTPWYDAALYKPVRIGSYEFIGVAYKTGAILYWDGERFTPRPGSMWTLIIWPGDRWRGLTEPAEGGR